MSVTVHATWCACSIVQLQISPAYSLPPSVLLGTVDAVKSCQFLDDRILQCIKQNAEKIKSGILNTSTLLKELLSWKVLSTEDYTTCFSSKNFLSEAVDYVISLLVEEKNRVKTRIFLHVLSELKEVDPKLAPWIQRLNSFGMYLYILEYCCVAGRVSAGL